MTESMQPFAFISYARADDKRGHVTHFREHLSDEVQVLMGREFPIFQDNVHIHWGEDWKDRIQRSLNEIVFFIPILTPSFFNSDMCREETTLFLQREKALKRNDLILPVYLVDCDLLNDTSQRGNDELALLIDKHHRVDWRKLRLKSYDEPEVINALEKLARDIKKAMQRPLTLPTPVHHGAMFGSPDYRLPGSVEELVTYLTAHIERRLFPKQSGSEVGSKKTTGRKSKPEKNAVALKGISRSKGLPKGKAGEYDRSVFIGGPFSDFYQPMFEAIVFAVVYAGFRPRSVFETSDGLPRLPRIMQLIEQCKYGIFDLSATGLSNGLPRFNPPFELGLFLGGWRYGSSLQKKKSVLVLDSQRYRYQRFISDLSSQDIEAHANNPKTVIQIVQNWLKASSRAITPSGAEIFKRYTLFKKARLRLCNDLGIQPEKLSYADYNELVKVWLREYEVLKTR